jgi:hypothetical protein
MAGVGTSRGATRQPCHAINVKFVMAGLGPAIHVFLLFAAAKDVDARAKPGHDENL